MLEKIPWSQVIIYGIVLGIIFYIMLYISLITMLLNITKNNYNWENIKKILTILR